ncbi:MAG TPA: ATP-binding protein [Vicinamibacterales bacterium]|nr:ATP-binding protein [Vicinamibacterales bacterium]
MTVASQGWRTEALWLAGTIGAIAGLVHFYVVWLNVTNPTIAALSFLLIVFVAAAVSTLRVAVVGSFVSALCFNFFFLPPVGTLTIADPQNWVALLTLLLVSVFVSRLSTRARARESEAVARRNELARLFDLTRDILLTPDEQDPIAAIAGHVARRFRIARVTIFKPGPAGWESHSAGAPLIVAEADLTTLMTHARTRLEFDATSRTYAGAGRVRAADGLVWVEPLRLGTLGIGLLALATDDIEPGTRDAIAGVTAIAIERFQLLGERKDAELIRRSAELKSALLAALSHDLRTPLTALRVAADNLTTSPMPERERQAQADLMRTEIARLTRLFENIAEMARIEAKAVSAELQWVHPGEIVESALQQLGDTIDRRRVAVTFGQEGSLVRVDPRLTSTALARIVENAADYSPAGSPIAIDVSAATGELRISIRDRGAGITPEDRERLFERFYRGAAGGQRFGTGMGLAITRGLLAAEHGRVWAENHPDGGAVFTLAIPTDTREAISLEERA